MNIKMKKRWMSGAAMMVFALVAGDAAATCYSGCDQLPKSVPASTPMTVQNTQTNIDQSSNQATQRENSHDMTNTRSGIIGGINVGHKNISVGNVGKNSKLDASITSTIILGDVKNE